MIIGIDGNEANVVQRVGIGEYAFELLKQFEKLRPANVTFEIYLKHKPIADLPTAREGWIYRVITPQKLWTQWRLPLELYLRKSKLDVFFTPSHYAPRFSPIPTVVSVMDLSYIHFPQLFNTHDLYQLTHWTKYSVKNAKKVITISNASKNDILNEYKVPADKVAVVHLGIKTMTDLTPNIYTMETLRSKYKIANDYLLFVGTLQPRKNIQRLIEAFALVIKDKKYTEHDLVIVGKKGWQYEEILTAPKKYGVEDKVKFLEFVSDNELPVLYSHAQCFVLPSLYEGFGLPVLEAMKYDCPVITSKVSSLPEAGGDAAVYVNPTDTQDIVRAIMLVLEDKELRAKMIKRGKEQIKKFSWEKSAQEVLAALEEVARK